MGFLRGLKTPKPEGKLGWCSPADVPTLPRPPPPRGRRKGEIRKKPPAMGALRKF
ncbi:hypothetical protein CRG98_003682 [Punica granatum]|uniref:Uncharacterized protein n=1 Tax=Punica granatum TaxID=22663 RepID=A0A2I0L5I4_PUNGR|nr:hypothetical protein CRG98_003682 [Punica granatum]